MTIQFPANPSSGDFYNVTPEKKYRFVNGAWKLHTNNQPLSALAPVPVFPPVVASAAPALDTNDAFWFDSDDNVLYFKKIVAGVPMWQPAVEFDLPIISDTPPALDTRHAFWFDSDDGVLYFKAVVNGTPSWVEAAPIEVPIVSDTAPALTTRHSFWYNASAYQLYFKQLVGQNLQWTKVKRKETSAALATGAIDVSAAELFTKTISAPTTFSVTNVPAAGEVCSFVLELTNGGAAAVTWFANIKWTGGTVPVLTAAGVDIIGFYTRDGGATWRGFVMSADSKAGA